MLKVVYSNDMRQLAAHLAEFQLAQPLPPMQPETIIVQSNELSRWLSLWLASTHGIAANLEFPFPSAYIWHLFREIWPDIPLQSPYSKMPLAWRIYQVLPHCMDETGFDPINAYLAGDADDVKRFQLAERLADTYDQYLMYRPDWIAAWEQGDYSNWQGLLWHKLIQDDSEPMHRANLLHRLHQLLRESDSPPAGLPERLSIFGISAMPPVYLHTFELLARFIDITIYYQSPSEHYWGDLRDDKQLQREQLTLDFEENEQESGHPLLASLGKQGQSFFRQLQDISHDSATDFVEPQPHSMLTWLKHDMFTLEQRDKRLLDEQDESIAIHVCHSPMREIEILHDQLLAMFECHPDLTPTDIVVMTPDIEVYAPWIEAVFTTADSERFIPFSIAESTGQQESVLLASFYQLLQLPQSRFDVESIIDLLNYDALQQRFDLDETALNWIRQWCQQTRTRWALDAQDKAVLDLPASEANTWRAGLDRLLLGYAMPLNEPGHNWRLFEGQLAMDGITGERAQIVANLCRLIDTLADWRQKLNRTYTITDWQLILNQCLDAFFDVERLDDVLYDAELTAIRKQLARLGDSAEQADFNEVISGEVILSWLQSNLEAVDTSHRFLGHGVTFCGMVPMRSVPFSMVCLIGMNDDVFPRRQPALSFDLLANHHREGDRSRRDDDRYLFLEALMSADDFLYISYVGASIVDNSAIPPSVLVSDLQDLLSERYTVASADKVLSQIVTHHPLQAFSRRYFDARDARLFSFNTAHCPPTETVEFAEWFGQALPETDVSWREVSRDQLIRFFRHPARYLLQERLGIRLDLEEDELDSREPFALDGLDNWQLRQHLLERKLTQNSDEGLKPLITATGMLPQGNMGDAWFEQAAQSVDSFVEKLKPKLPQTETETLAIDLQLGEFQVYGQLESVSSQGLLRYRLANKKGKDLLAAWIDHLLLNIERPAGIKLETHLILQDAELLFTPVAEAATVLSNLLELYWQGCHSPLKYFDQTSLAYAKAALGGKPETAFRTAQRKWQSSGDFPGEGDDIYYRRLYKESPLDDEFAEIAMQIYGPIQASLQGGEL